MVTPWACNGSIRCPSGLAGRSDTPIICGCEGPYISASSKPTFSPARASDTARLEVTVDLPTPPLPEPTAMMCLTPGIGCGPACAVGWPPSFSEGACPCPPELRAGAAPAAAVVTICTFSIPGSSSRRRRTSSSTGAMARAAAASATSSTNRTVPPSTVRARTRSASPRLRPSGRVIPDISPRTTSRVTVMSLALLLMSPTA